MARSGATVGESFQDGQSRKPRRRQGPSSTALIVKCASVSSTPFRAISGFAGLNLPYNELRWVSTPKVRSMDTLSWLCDVAMTVPKRVNDPVSLSPSPVTSKTAGKLVDAAM